MSKDLRNGREKTFCKICFLYHQSAINRINSQIYYSLFRRGSIEKKEDSNVNVAYSFQLSVCNTENKDVCHIIPYLFGDGQGKVYLMITSEEKNSKKN